MSKPEPETPAWNEIYPEMKITEIEQGSFIINIKPEQLSSSIFELELNCIMDIGNFDYTMNSSSTSTSFRINEVTRDQVQVLIDQAQDLAIQDWQIEQLNTINIPAAKKQAA